MNSRLSQNTLHDKEALERSMPTLTELLNNCNSMASYTEGLLKSKKFDLDKRIKMDV